MKFLIPAILLMTAAPLANAQDKALAEHCFEALNALPGKHKDEALRQVCGQVSVLPQCESEKGVKIFHFDRAAKTGAISPKKILVIALIHGDELPSGSVARSWMERMTNVEPRNAWRVIPILNPDGVKSKTRYNANGVDVNRNFPTKDWDKEALKYWEQKTHKDKRRYPGAKPATEKETLCAMAHIDDFNPDLILSIHTPYGVLDFDGPKIPPPTFPTIPWKNLGNYPGSLGRYMWVDRSKPILTIELHDKGVVEKLDRFDRLQDIGGDIAIKAEKTLKDKEPPAPKSKK